MRRVLLVPLLLAARLLAAAGGAEPASRAADRPDLLIRQAVLDRLAWDDRVRPVLLDAVVREGRVVLLGTVPTAAARAAAGADARDLPGVRSVDNRLEVQPLPPPSPMRRSAGRSACCWTGSPTPGIGATRWWSPWPAAW